MDVAAERFAGDQGHFVPRSAKGRQVGCGADGLILPAFCGRTPLTFGRHRTHRSASAGDTRHGIEPFDHGRRRRSNSATMTAVNGLPRRNAATAAFAKWSRDSTCSGFEYCPWRSARLSVRRHSRCASRSWRTPGDPLITTVLAATSGLRLAMLMCWAPSYSTFS